VIFYTIDYVPVRFKNRLLNFIYRKIDIFCAENADSVWNLSKRINDARIKAGMREIHNAIVVPIGVNFQRIKRAEERSINRKTLVYMGFLDKKRGLEFIIGALPDMIRKNPDLKLMVIGGGSAEEYYRQMVNEAGLVDYVDFKGYIKDHREVEALLSRCAVGLAIYEPYEGNFTWYTDPSKPKQYMACGLPVIITGKPEIADEIQNRKLGIAIDYEKDKFVEAVTLLLNDDRLYFDYRKNAIDFASGIEWSAIFERAFKDACS
jgi:glycosyltransferase involved in cell wall biosynthesis